MGFIITLSSTVAPCVCKCLHMLETIHCLLYYRMSHYVWSKLWIICMEEPFLSIFLPYRFVCLFVFCFQKNIALHSDLPFHSLELSIGEVVHWTAFSTEASGIKNHKGLQLIKSTSFFKDLFLFYIMSICVCVCALYNACGARGGHEIPWSYRPGSWMLHTEPRSSGRAISTLICWAISLDFNTNIY